MSRFRGKTLGGREATALSLLALACRRWRGGGWGREVLIESRQQRLDTCHQRCATEQHSHLISDSGLCQLGAQTRQFYHQAGVLRRWQIPRTTQQAQRLEGRGRLVDEQRRQP